MHTEKNRFISVGILKGYPNTSELKQKDNRSRKRKSIIVTDAPEINIIEGKAKEIQVQKELEM